MQWSVAREFVADYSNLIRKLLPHYSAEGKRYLTIAVGCTGGKHRSVVITQELAERLRGSEFDCTVCHRDLQLE